MTDRERNLVAGLLSKVMTGTLDSSKTLDEQCEDFVDIGEKVLELMRQEKIKECEDKIRTCHQEMYNQQILTVMQPIHIPIVASVII